jgi:hypothetical protein
MSIQSIEKIDNIADLLKNAKKSSFLDCFLSLFIQYVENEPGLRNIMDILSDKNKEHKDKIKEIINNRDGDIGFFGYKKENIKTFDEYVACCWFYLKYISGSGNRILHKFFDPIDKSGEGKPQRLFFFYECIKPIILYIKLQTDHFLNAICILKRYKVLCEWYDREQIMKKIKNSKKAEISLTKRHLNKYLFKQGFTYSLAETNVPSGRIDNLAFSIGINKEQLKDLPDVIIAEGKIFKRSKNIFNEVFEQVRKRLNDLNLLDGYCVIYNKTNQVIKIQDKTDEIAGIPYLLTDNKKIFFIVVNLGDAFIKNSPNQLKKVDINIIKKKKKKKK